MIIFEIHDAIPSYFAHKLTFCWNIIHGPQKKLFPRKVIFLVFIAGESSVRERGPNRGWKRDKLTFPTFAH